MQQFQPYLFFGGRCAEAMQFYERVLGGRLTALMKYRDAPPQPEPEGCAGNGPLPPEAMDLVMHAALAFEEGLLMASDMPPNMPYEGMKGVSVAISLPTVARAREVLDALAEGGQVLMPMGETFWVEAFGCVTDRFGTSWMINGGKSKIG